MSYSAIRLALLTALVLSASSNSRAAGQGAAAGEAKDVFHESFKGLPADAGKWKFVGPAAKKCVAFEPEGLRITLPQGFQKVRGFTGLITEYPMQGDFGVTVSFEILAETPDDDAEFASRLALSVHLDTPVKDIHGVNRVLAQQRSRFVAWHAWTEAPGKQRTNVKLKSADARSGRLRIIRKGERVSYYAAEGNGGFELIQDEPAVKGDVKDIRIAAQTGGPNASVDARITDLRVHSADVAALEAPVVEQPAQPAESPAGSRWKLWLAAGIVGALFVIAISLLLFRRRVTRSPAQRTS